MSHAKIATSNSTHSPDTTTSGSSDKSSNLASISKRANLARLRDHLRSSVQTQTSCASSSTSSGNSSGSFDLTPPPLVPGVLVPNSALVHQRASSVSDHLAAASAHTGASLPLMIGNRSKCVVNLVDEVRLSRAQDQQTTGAPVPQNTAIRAEQRRQNMSVSVVRPVVVVNSTQASEGAGGLIDDGGKQSLLDEWITFDKSYLESRANGRGAGSFLEELLSLPGNHNQLHQGQRHQVPSTKSEYDIRQQVALLRREEGELNRNVRRQHQFMVEKLEQRRRHLAIIQSVWAQRDFKHAIEKLVDIYQQGLIFATNEHWHTGGGGADGAGSRSNGVQAAQLKSLHTSLAVDVIGIIILRPRLWTLDTCQLLLPIINQDLLVPPPPPARSSRAHSGGQPGAGQSAQHEYYAEVGLKALRLILTNFSSIIKSTLESLKDSGKLVGIDLSREERVNKCLACFRLLLDSHSNLSALAAGQRRLGLSQENKLAAQQRELQTMFVALFNSIQLEPNILAKRLQQSGGVG